MERLNPSLKRRVNCMLRGRSGSDYSSEIVAKDGVFLLREAEEDYGPVGGGVRSITMKLFKAKGWSVVDIGLLKWCCILIGMIVGAYLSDFTKRYVWVIAVAALLVGIKPTISYFRNDNE